MKRLAFVLAATVATLSIAGTASAEGIDPYNPTDTGWGPAEDQLPDVNDPTDTGWGPALADYSLGFGIGTFQNAVHYLEEVM